MTELPKLCHHIACHIVQILTSSIKIVACVKSRSIALLCILKLQLNRWSKFPVQMFAWYITEIVVETDAVLSFLGKGTKSFCAGIRCSPIHTLASLNL